MMIKPVGRKKAQKAQNQSDSFATSAPCRGYKRFSQTGEARAS
jgi:hypothetical protein